jgi:hypothetical protein
VRCSWSTAWMGAWQLAIRRSNNGDADRNGSAPKYASSRVRRIYSIKNMQSTNRFLEWTGICHLSDSKSAAIRDMFRTLPPEETQIAEATCAIDRHTGIFFALPTFIGGVGRIYA